MSALIGTILVFAFVFGILVFVHEFGHFFMAKLVGIRVEVFSWGYGKRLAGIKKGETDYRISMIPLGGFVKFSGEEVLDEKREMDSRDFMAKSRWERFLVLIMGSLMNICLAVILMSIINMSGVSVSKYMEEKPVIGWIEAGSPAEKAGLKVDDEILSINNRKIDTWSDLEMALRSKPDKMIDIEIKRGEQVQVIQLQTESRSFKLTRDSRTRIEMGYAGIVAKIWPQVMMVTSGSPADEAGILPGDVIREIDGRSAHYFEFTEIIQEYPEQEIDFGIVRDGEWIHLMVTPKREGDVGVIGVSSTIESIKKQVGFFGAIAQSVKENARMGGMVITFIKDLLTGEASTRQLGGPIAIANISYEAFKMGFMTLIWWIAFISLQLGIINLFPIPMFDGGHILVLGLEGLFRRDFSVKVKQFIMQIGFVLVIILFVFIILNDVVKRLPNGWDSLIPF
jgi:regulator of sigma E protease